MDTGKILKEAGLRPRKGLGQNFLVDPSVPPRIANAAELRPDDVVIEVGPGLGVLTRELAERLDPQAGRLIAVELDDSLLPVLHERMAEHPQFRLVPGDILELAPETLLASGDAVGRPYKLVANLPYYITSAVLRHFLSNGNPPEALVVMVQREVAERIVAAPPEMSLLAVSVQFYGVPKIMFRVPPGAFMPPPKVESAVLRVQVYPPGERPISVSDEDRFFEVLRAGFAQKRKQLANSLTAKLDISKPDITLALGRAGVDGSRRAETLTLPEWAAIVEQL